MQCQGTLSGTVQQCKKRAKNGQFCAQHAKKYRLIVNKWTRPTLMKFLLIKELIMPDLAGEIRKHFVTVLNIHYHDYLRTTKQRIYYMHLYKLMIQPL